MTDRTAAPSGASAARGTTSRLPSLTGARFIAAFLVFLFHSMAVYPLVDPGALQTPVSLFGPAGFTGVTFFFVLSGFVLTWAFRPTDTAPKFWRRRFFKIYPLHLLTFTVIAVLLAVFGPMPQAQIADSTFWNGVINALLLQSWSPDFQTGTSFNVVSWSLSCEALMYLAFPILIKLVNRVRDERLWFWTILSGASVAVVAGLAMLVPGGTAFPGQGFTDVQLWIVFRLPPVQVLTFVFGIFLAKVVISGRRIPLGLGGAVALTIGAYFVTPLFPAMFQFSAVMVIPLGLLVAAGARADVEGQKTFLGSRPMVWLGNISFAFYMWHYIVLAYGHQILGQGDTWSTPTAIGAMVLIGAAAVLVSWATFSLFEQPIMKRFATSRRKRTLVAVASGPGSSGDGVRDRAA